LHVVGVVVFDLNASL